MKLKTKYKLQERPQISGPDSVFEMAADYRSYEQECFVVYYLDSQNAVIQRQVCTIGLLNQCQIDVREVFSRALMLRCKSIILSHNHPSGKCDPSPADRAITKKLKEAGDILGIAVLDHVIVSHNDAFSFQERGLI